MFLLGALVTLTPKKTNKQQQQQQQNTSEYDQEMPQLQIIDKTTAPRGRATEELQPHDSKATGSLFLSENTIKYEVCSETFETQPFCQTDLTVFLTKYICIKCSIQGGVGLIILQLSTLAMVL